MRLRQLLPEPAEIDPVAAHAAFDRTPPPGRPWVMLNMVESVDGATNAEGASGDLGGEPDRVVFFAIRALPDVILAGAGTIRADGYGPPRTPEPRRAERIARGQTPYPRIAAVTRSGDLDADSTLFTEAPEPPLVFTTRAADPIKLEALRQRAEVVVFDGPDVEAPEILAYLQGLGVRSVLVEGGPSLNGRFLHADAVDEIDLTISPQLIGGASARITKGAPETRQELRIGHLWEAEDVLLLRYLRA